MAKWECGLWYALRTVLHSRAQLRLRPSLAHTLVVGRSWNCPRRDQTVVHGGGQKNDIQAGISLFRETNLGCCGVEDYNQPGLQPHPRGVIFSDRGQVERSERARFTEAGMGETPHSLRA